MSTTMRGVVTTFWVLLLACVPMIDEEAQLKGDPGSEAWECTSQEAVWNPQAKTGPAAWGGNCHDTWTCSDGKFVTHCQAHVEGYWSCECEEKGALTGRTFNASGWCDLDQDPPGDVGDKEKRANVGCGWKLPINEQTRQKLTVN
ncbi:MAG: hypothetical protein AB2A00_30945 [Myxococcota bacterium]